MKKRPNMLMVGAAGRNLGKTEFICGVIQALSSKVPVVGIKVTAFEGAIPPDKDYLHIPGDYLVTREIPAGDHKDTHRMYRAGAEHVYWLRSRRGQLAEGLNHLIQTMKMDGVDVETGCLVAEAVCARRFIDPGLYFIIREPGGAMKPSCAETVQLADRLLNPLGDGWDDVIDHLSFENGRWHLCQP